MVSGLGRGRAVSGMTEQQIFRAGMLPGYGPWMTGGGGAGILMASKTAQQSKEAAKAIDEVTGSSSSLTKASKGLNDTLRRTGFGALRAKNAFGLLGGVLQQIPGWAKAAIIGLFAFREAFKHGMLLEGQKIIFETLTGSMQRASDLIKKTRRFSILTPFRPEEVMGATTTAVQYGVRPFEGQRYGLKAGQTPMDIFAGLGSMINPLTGAALGINRMATAILRGDYRLLRPVRGIVNPAYEAAKATGHKVGTPGFNEKFIQELGKIPAIMQLAERHSTSVQGLWSTISGMWQEFWMDFTGAGEQKGVLTFWSQIRDIMFEIRNNILPAYEKMQSGIREFGARVGSVIKLIYTVGKEILPALALGGFIKFLPILLKIGAAAMKMIPIFRILRLMLLSKFIEPLLPLLLKVAEVLNQVGIFVTTTLTKAFQFLTRIVESFLGAFFGTRIDDVIGKMSEFVTGLQIFVQWWGAWLDIVFGKLEKKIVKFFKTMDLSGHPLTKKIINWFLPSGEKIPETVAAKEHPIFKKSAETVMERAGSTLNKLFGQEAPAMTRGEKLDYLRNTGVITDERSKLAAERALDKFDQQMRGFQARSIYEKDPVIVLKEELTKIRKGINKTNDHIVNDEKVFMDKNKIKNIKNQKGLDNSRNPALGY